MAKKLPKRLFVRWEDPGDGDLYLTADINAHAAAPEDGKWAEVGTYKLVSTERIRRASHIEKKPGRAAVEV